MKPMGVCCAGEGALAALVFLARTLSPGMSLGCRGQGDLKPSAAAPRVMLQGLSASKNRCEQNYSFVKASDLNPWRSISKNDGKVSDKKEKCKGL